MSENIKNKYNCSICNFSSEKQCNLNKHFLTKKHVSKSETSVEVVSKYNCEKCNKSYKGQSGLWQHKRKCKVEINNVDNVTETNTVSNDDIQELKRMIMELKQSSITTINNEITNNNTFNINVFLNDKCSKAINMDDFIKNICYEFGDFNKMLEDYVGGSMSILKQNMSQIPLHKRPMHYLEGEDKNQQVFHIRQNDIWKTETEINWLKQINADDDDVLEKQTLYFALKQLDNDKLKYLRYKYSANHDYMKNHKRLNCEVTRVDKKMKLYDEVIKMISLDPKALTN
jgi:hypothetical protein